MLHHQHSKIPGFRFRLKLWPRSFSSSGIGPLDVKDTDGPGRRLEETIRYSQQLELKCQEQAVEKESERKDFQS